MTTRKFDRTHLINVLKALKDNYIYIAYDENSKKVIVKDNKTSINFESK